MRTVNADGTITEHTVHADGTEETTTTNPDGGSTTTRTDKDGNERTSTYDPPPEAQHGAYVRGTRRGRRLIVGENYQDEVIRPLREAPESGGEMTVNVMIDGETVATATTRAASEGAG